MRALIANYDQLCAVPKVPVPGTPRIQAATTKWLYHLAPEGYRVPLLYRMKKLGVSARCCDLDLALMALRRLEKLVPSCVI
eukprot:2445953-Pyramimonas_sp.AAC.1